MNDTVSLEALTGRWGDEELGLEMSSSVERIETRRGELRSGVREPAGRRQQL